jgi:osmotically inducible protein OsmC
MALATAKSTANAVWEGSLMEGGGKVSAASGMFSDLAVSWSARTERPTPTTSPEELLASAHAACYSMALSNGLAKAGTPPTKLEVSATVTFAQQEVGWKVASSALTVKGTVPGATAESFQEAAEAAKDGCPISKAITGNVELSVEATLA